MNTSVLTKQQDLKFKIPISILATLSLVIVFSSRIFFTSELGFVRLLDTVPQLFFVLYIYKFKDKANLFLAISSVTYIVLNICNTAGSLYYLLKFEQSIAVTGIIADIGTITFYISLILFSIESIKKSKQQSSNLRKLICALTVIALIFKILSQVLSLIYGSTNILNFFLLTISTALAPLFLILYICRITNKSNLLLLIVSAFSAVISLFSIYSSFVIYQRYINESFGLNYLSNFIYSVGGTMFYIALILLAISSPNNKEQLNELTPEQELNLIKEKLELGIITTEEYQAKRNEIISKL